MDGVELIAIERKRQIEELKWDYKDKELYDNNELASAAAVYALPQDDIEFLDGQLEQDSVKLLWPWNNKYYKPTPNDRVRELVKAGALIAAQIDYELAKTKSDEKQ